MEANTTDYGQPKNMRLAIDKPIDTSKAIKKALLYGCFVLLIIAAITLVFTTNIEWDLSFYIKKIIFLSALLIVGILHTFLYPAFLPNLQNKKLGFGLWFTLLLAVLCGIVTFALFYVAQFNYKQIALAAACSFLLPAIIAAAWKYFEAISTKTYQAWVLPAKLFSQNKTSLIVDSLKIKIKFKINQSAIEEKIFSVTVPRRMLLGKMFQQFIMDRKSDADIELTHKGQKPYGWRFLLQKSFGTILLDPETSIANNKIKENDSIVIERLPVTQEP